MSTRKLTDARVEAILNALKNGCTRRAAAAVGGVHHATFYRWIDADATLRDEVEKAESIAEAAFTSVVAKASVESWQAAAWWLERRRSADYARREKVDLTVDLRKEAARIAADQGLDEAEVFAEMQAILHGAA